jgi:hypothetical protein
VRYIQVYESWQIAKPVPGEWIMYVQYVVCIVAIPLRKIAPAPAATKTHDPNIFATTASHPRSLLSRPLASTLFTL